MSIFKLPDLGEGLPDAEVHEWHVKVGDVVKTDDPLVSMETAKAVVDVPAPQDGKILKLHGKPGEIIKTGSPLVEFENDNSNEKDAGTVVGNIPSSNVTITEATQSVSGVKVTPAVRAIAKKLNVDLGMVKASGPDGLITLDDVKIAAKMLEDSGELELLHGVRRAMAMAMSKSHTEIVPVSLFDDADIHAWADKTDIMVRVIRSIVEASKAEPSLNAWYDGKKMGRRINEEVNLGIAVDTEEGLFVPVIKGAGKLSAEQLREQINTYKASVRDRSTPQDAFHGASITLSNFGNFAGRYASPVIIPPQVAIIGVGRLRDEVVAFEGKPTVHRVMPLSLTFDHRAVTGGESTRFLAAMIEDLEKSS